MPYLIAGALLLWLSLPTLRAFTRMSPRLAAALVRSAGGIACLAVAVFLLMRGRPDFAAMAGVAGLWLIGRSRVAGKPSAFQTVSAKGLGSRPGKSAGKGAGNRGTSRVRSAMIEMELDHATGDLRGLVLAGSFQDRNLDTLASRECALLLAECRLHDPDAGRLLEAYLDRRFPGWRATEKDGVDGGSSVGSDRSFASGPMTDNEAYEVLGLRKGATRDEISRAHRALMKKLHPDQGGPTQLAARVNEAKEILLKRHT